MNNQFKEKFYGRRKGRTLSTGQLDLLQSVLEKNAVHLPKDSKFLNIQELFQKPYDHYNLEIGFGSGEHLITQAKNNPSTGFIGVEVFLNGLVNCVQQMQALRLNNIRLYSDDVRPLLRGISDESLDQIFILFPDPWPKARHHKRRLINPENLKIFARLLKLGGKLRIASDDVSYLEWIEDTFQKQHDFLLIKRYTKRPPDWPSTRYEQKALKKGRVCHYFIFQRQP